MSTADVFETADNLVTLHRAGEYINDRHVLNIVNLLCAGTDGNPNARARRIMKLVRTFKLTIART
jgi:hypothetical protein